MKRILLFTAAICLLSGTMQAQSVRFIQNGEALSNNASISIYNYDEDMGSMDWKPVLRNTTQKAVDVVIQTNVISNPNSDFLSLCLGTNCYPPNIMETPIITIPAGAEDSSFHTMFIPMSPTSIATASYTIINVNDETDYQTVTITYDYPAFLAGIDKTRLSSQIKLMQRGDNLVCNYKFDTQAKRSIVLSNIVGAKVAAFAINNNSGEIVLNSKLAKGIYVYTLVENGRNVKSHKIIIR